jgi:capsular exopolysaccharide synthesis family protein
VANLVPHDGRNDSGIHNARKDPLDLGSVAHAHSKTATEFAGIREYFAIVRRHLWIVLGVLVLSVGYTANQARKEVPLYRAASTVRLVDARRAITGDMTQAGSGDAPFSYQVDQIESQIQVLNSEAVASVAVDLKGLRLVPAPKQQWVTEINDIVVAENPSTQSVALKFNPATYALTSNARTVSARYGQPAEIDGVRLVVSKRPTIAGTVLNVIPRGAAIGMALGGIQASQRGKTDILDISYTATEPVQAQRMANAIAEAFQVQNATSAQQLSRRRRSFLENQLRQTDSMLAQASASYSAFRSNRQVFSSAARGGAQEASLIDIETRRADLDAEKRMYESLLAQAKEGGSSLSTNLRALMSSPGLSQNVVVNQLYMQLSGYERARDSLVNRGAAPTNPDVMAITSMIPPTVENLLDAVQSQIQSLNARITALDRVRAAGATRIAAAPAAETQEQELSQQVQTIRNTADQLRSELQRARMSEAVEAGQVQIIQLATYPGYRIATGKNRKLVIGVLVGLMLGFGAAVVLDSLDASIRRRSDIEKMLGVPSLAVIPRLPSANGLRGPVARALPRLMASSSPRNGRPDQDLVILRDARSPAAEAIRTLRTNLMFSQAVRSMRTLVVTSASPSEGKTTTASNLAAAFAQQGMRVLLLDCDLRRARLHRMFSVPREPGLTDLVLGYADEDAVTRATEVTGLYLIPSGKLPPNPAELLGGEQMRRTIASLVEGYDLIIVDTPPLLAAADAAILSTLANGVILVLRAGATENAAAQQSVQQLNAVGARIVGAVLNDPDTQVPKYGAYYEYEYASAET